MGSTDFENTVVFSIPGLTFEGLKNSFGELWEKLPEDVQEDIQWVGKTPEGDGFNPGAIRAITDLIAELSDGINLDKVTADQAEYLWEKMIDTMEEHDLYGARLYLLYKEYAQSDPMLMLGHILNVSEDFLSAKEGKRK
jgi:hypothetical protein